MSDISENSSSPDDPGTKPPTPDEQMGQQDDPEPSSEQDGGLEPDPIPPA